MRAGLTVVELPVDRADKATRFGAYASQVPAIIAPWARNLAKHLPATERVWLLPPRPE